MRDTTSYKSECLLSRRQEIISVGEDMKKRYPSYTAGGNVNWWNTMKNSMEMEVTKKTKAVFFFFFFHL